MTTRHAAIDSEAGEIVGVSQALAGILEQVRAVATTGATVLIFGETGVGKELIARRIHDESRRCRGPMITVNCASIPRDLFESEFFGHVRGAFTGALRDRVGRIEAADGGTLFLDEVGEIPLELQGKLLRTLQHLSFERVGEDRTRQADVRFIAATNRNLLQETTAGRFRLDLYYRLSVFPIEVPPLRARSEDITTLAHHILSQLAARSGRAERGLSAAQVRHLHAYEWPGNVRELKNVLERAFILSGDGPLRLDLGLPASTLSSRLKVLNIQQPEPTSLYSRLGGHKAIATFAHDIFGRVLADPLLSRFWAHRSTIGILREEQLFIAYLSSVSGGPAKYSGRDMKSAHRHLGITPADWDAFRGHLRTTLGSLAVAPRERQEITDFAQGLRSEIVSDA